MRLNSTTRELVHTLSTCFTMIKNILKKLFLSLTSPLVKKNKAIEEHFELLKYKEKWDKYFSDKGEIIFTHDTGIKLILHRKSKLTEFILFHDFEKKEINFFNSYLRKGDIVLDIGANIGLHSLIAARLVQEEGHVYSFEPAPDTYNQFLTNLQLNGFSNITPVNMGLSDKKATLKMNISSHHDAWNTLADVSKLDELSGIFDNAIEINVVKLDDWLQDNNIDTGRIALIKLDVEGWEKFVLVGGEAFLKENAPVLMVEFDEKNAWAAGYLCHQTYDILKGYGYNLYSFSEGVLKAEEQQLHYPSQNLFAIKDKTAFKGRLHFA